MNKEELNIYVKKPIPIQAVQQPKEFIVETLEGTMKGKKGDYLITGIKGEQYPCDKDVFEESYVLESEQEPMVAKNSSELGRELMEYINEYITNVKPLTKAQIIGELYLMINSIANGEVFSLIHAQSGAIKHLLEVKNGGINNGSKEEW